MPSFNPLKFASLMRKRARPERREVRRLVPEHATSCLLRFPDSAEPITTWVYNLSVKGIGLVADQEYAPGTAVSVLLVNASHTYSLALDLRVVRCYPLVSGHFFVGAQFTRMLNFDELLPFMV